MVLFSLKSMAKEKPLPAHGLKLPATFTGGTEHIKGQVSTWVLNMWPDQTFQYNQIIGATDKAGRTISGYGRWYSNPSTQTLALDHGREKPLFFRVKSANELMWADPDGSANDSVLQGSNVIQTLELSDLILSGMMVYMADAASISLCQGNVQFAIAMTGDYLALERAYLAERPAPGEPLFVMFQGRLAEHDSMEGPTRQMAVIDKFLRTEPGKTCDRQMANSSFFNTYWRIDEIAGTAIVQDDSFRWEPHLLLLEDGSRYSLTVGCNLMRGGVSVDSEKVSFTSAASTMMACPPPIDELEQTIGKALGQVIRFVITGDSLTLMSEDGIVLVSLTAVYF